MVCWFKISSSGIVSEGGRDSPTLDELQEACGGYVELITLPKTYNQIWTNEEGRIRRLPVNEAATALLWDSALLFAPQIVGPVVMVYTGDNDYEDCYEHIMQYDTSVRYENNENFGEGEE